MSEGIDIVRYDPVSPNTSWHEASDKHSRLPDAIRARLFSDARYVAGPDVCAHTRDQELQRFLDDYFEIDTKRTFIKWRDVEIPCERLNEYRFYRIDPQECVHNRHVFFGVKQPQCSYTDDCPWGADITTAVRVHETVLSKLGIAEVLRSWQLGVELLISARVKRLFEENGVTGLEYEACEAGTAERKSTTSDVRAFVARIRPRVQSTAEDVLIVGRYCFEHRIITKSSYVFGERSPDFQNVDLQIIDRVQVGNREYRYESPRWAVSSRLVALLLRERVRGLTRRTVVLNEKFSPIVYLK